MGKRIYTREQLELIRNKYKNLSCREIATELGIKTQSVRYALRKYWGINLREDGKDSRSWNEEEIKILADANLTDSEKAQRIPSRTSAAIRTQRKRLGFESKKIIFKRRFRNSQGYLYVRQNNKYIKKCTLVAQGMLGRPLKSSEVVHHINGNKRDDREENLFIATRFNHPSIHYQAMEVIEQLMEKSIVGFDRGKGEYILCQHL